MEQQDEGLRIVNREGPAQAVPICVVESVMVLGHAQVTTQALRLCMINGIPVHYGTRGGKLIGACMPTVNGRLERRLRQYGAYQEERTRLSIAKSFVIGKTKRQLLLLDAYRKRIPKASIQERYFEGQLSKIGRIKTLDALLGLEGEMAKRYFASFSHLLRNMEWQGRNRQPPKDPVNALLSLCYMLVLGDLTSAIAGAGFEVGIGFLHTVQSTRPSLACDFLELFRPRIDQFVIQLFNRNEMREAFFEQDGEGVLLRKECFSLFMDKYDAFRPEASEYREPLMQFAGAVKEGRAPDFG